MEPEAHRLDREELLAGRREAAERVRREVDEALAAAAAKRRAFLDRFIAELRADLQSRLERERFVADVLEAVASGGAAAAARRPAVAPTGWSDEADARPLVLVRAAASASR